MIFKISGEKMPADSKVTESGLIQLQASSLNLQASILKLKDSSFKLETCYVGNNVWTVM